ncbi:MAG: SDR family NAD(P)-dependent oxidoreductase [bacterium]
MEKANKSKGAIAVVGVSAIFPGSDGIQDLWNNILQGKNFISDVPPDHWLIEDYYDPDKSKAGKIYTNKGAFLPEIDFDPIEYGITPNSLSSIDTVQLLSLVACKRLLDDVESFKSGKLSKEKTSIILGVASATEMVGQMSGKIQKPHWVKALRESGIPEQKVEEICDRIISSYPPWTENTFPGLLGNVVTGRIANRFDLKGTNCVIDSACASSLGAMAMAIQELQLEISDLVITGGADALNDPVMFMCFSKTLALSPTGDCRPFSESADGTMLGEGIGMLALRRLEDAERDDDKIYAVIRGFGSSSDGKSKSVYAPRPEGQCLAINRAYERLEYTQREVQLIEAHGTATIAGDKAEFEGLTMSFNDKNSKQWCALGSIKSQIGHTKAAAGAASLLKVVMALHHKVLPPTIKVDIPNKSLDFENSPFYLNTEARPWIHDSLSTRKASVSSFGFGGSNFHVTLEEYSEKSGIAKRYHNSPVELILLSASSKDEMIIKLEGLLKGINDSTLVEFARKNQCSFNPKHPFRLALLANDSEDLSLLVDTASSKIQRLENGKPSFSIRNKIHFGYGVHSSRIAFIFPGQGSHYLNMGKELAIEFNEARSIWDSTTTVDFGKSTKLHDVVFPIPVFTEEERHKQLQLLTHTEWAQPGIGATSLSQLSLLYTLGLRPNCVAGHSYGEVTALYAANVIQSIEEFLYISRKRGELMAEASDIPGAMTVALCSEIDMKNYLEKWKSNICIANINGPEQVVLSGPVSEITLIEDKLRKNSITFKRLQVSTAFHSDIVKGCVKPFRDFISSCTINRPTCPVYSNISAGIYPEDPKEIITFLSSQISKPVLFKEQIENMYRDGVRTFIEIGPDTILTNLIGKILKGNEHLAVSLDSKKTDGLLSFWNALGALSAAGIPLKFEKLWGNFASSMPIHAELSPVTVKLNGSNYGKPYPPKDGAKGRPEPVEESAEYKSHSKERVSDDNDDLNSRSNMKDSHFLKAFNQLQKNALGAQQNFQKSLTEAHLSYLRTSEIAIQRLLQLSGNISKHDLDNPVPWKEEAEVIPQDTNSSFDSIRRGSVLIEDVPNTESHNPVPHESIKAGYSSSISRSNFESVLLRAVSDKTGYPSEMLDLDLDLESGFGIDSIKRVEILSALQEEIPQLPEINAEELGVLNTLNKILDFADQSIMDIGVEAFSDKEAAVSEDDFQAILLRIVSEKTGYPLEMLDFDLDLESGFGIDSIKRVEILSVLQEEIPQLPEINAEELVVLNTLGKVLDYANQSFSSGEDLFGELKSPEIENQKIIIDNNEHKENFEANKIYRYQIRLVEAPPCGIAVSGLLCNNPLVIIEDNRGVATILAEKFKEIGIRTEIADKITSAAQYVLFLKGINYLEEEDWEGAIELNYDIFEAASVCAKNFFDNKTGVFITVQDTNGDFGLSEDIGIRAWTSGIASLAKTAKQEWENVTVKAIDIQCGNSNSNEIAETIFSELTQGGPELEIGLRQNGKRLRVEVYESDEISNEKRFSEDDVILVSGGARGVTANCLIELAHESKFRIVILGRTSLFEEDNNTSHCQTDAKLKKMLLSESKKEGVSIKPIELKERVKTILQNREVKRTIKELEELGLQIKYFPCDICNRKDVYDIVHKVENEWGQIRGVIHAAGVLSDKYIHEKKLQQFKDVFNTKVWGLYNILSAVSQEDLSCLCCFSSVAARFGNQGQVDYSMANEILNRVCHSFSMKYFKNCTVKSINWGPWDGGMVGSGLKSYFKSHGINLIPVTEGSKIFTTELMNNNEGAVEVIIGDRLSHTSQLRRETRGQCNLHINQIAHPFLNSHRIKDIPVVPVMMVNEWCIRIASMLFPELRFISSNDLKVIHGIQLSNYDTNGDWFHIKWEIVAIGEFYYIDFMLQNMSGIIYYTLTVKMGPRMDYDLSDNSIEDPEYKSWDMSVDLIYENMLFHGRHFHVINRLEQYSDNSCSAVLKGNGSLDMNREQWKTDMVVLDGGIQLAYLFILNKLNQNHLPSGFDSFSLIKPGFFDTQVNCHVKLVSHDNLKAKWNLIYKVDEITVAIIRGLISHLVPSDITPASKI